MFPCRARDKRPATANGLRDATRDAEIIRAWWSERPDYNIAIATGAISGIFVSTLTASTPNLRCAGSKRSMVCCPALSK